MCLFGLDFKCANLQIKYWNMGIKNDQKEVVNK